MVKIVVYQSVWVAYHEIDLFGPKLYSCGKVQLDAGVTYECSQIDEEYIEHFAVANRIALKASDIKPHVLSGAIEIYP